MVKESQGDYSSWLLSESLVVIVRDSISCHVTQRLFHMMASTGARQPSGCPSPSVLSSQAHLSRVAAGSGMLAPVMAVEELH